MRIASLLSSNTEMVCAIGLGDRLVAISHECDHPAAILHLPRVTRICVDASASSGEIDREVNSRLRQGLPLYEIDVETLQGLKPDLLLTQAQCAVCAINDDDVRAAVARFPAEGRPQALSFAPESLADVFEDMERLGAATGAGEGARRAVADLQRRVEAVKEAVADEAARPRTLVLEWLDPPMPGGCWTPQLVEMAGGTPVLSKGSAKTYARTWDEVGETGAEILLASPCGFQLGQTLREIGGLLDRPAVRSLPALRDERVFLADGNALFNRPGPRLVDTLELLAHAIQPEAVRRAGIPLPEGMAMRWSGAMADGWTTLTMRSSSGD